MNKPLYLDSHATTQVDKRVLDKMLPYFSEIYGNPTSIDNLHGAQAQQAVKEARKVISTILGCKKENEIIFTAGATESNNIALIGSFRKFKHQGNHIICSAIEHSSVLNTLKYLESEGAEVTYLPVRKNGIISIDDLKKAIKPDTILISIMYANNEIGTIQPIQEIGDLAKENKILFHCDAAQAAGYEKIDVYKQNIDLMSFSGHKIYGPKGIGGLFIRSFMPIVRINPIFFGGEQERGLRSGTLNVPGIVGLAEALKLLVAESASINKKNREFSKQIYDALKSKFPDIKLNGDISRRLAHSLSLTIPGVESKALMLKLKNDLTFSAGSACSTIKVEPSHVLKAIGLSDEETYQTIRLGLSKFTDDQQVEFVTEKLVDGIGSISRN
ncbi:MAG: cysteine desulfurase [Candidatus Delongbacteria bacterium]|nr:cysteine desulfurase [Candidatus Delongbacteria bacterium]